MLKILGTLMKNVWIKDLQLHQDGKTKVRGSNLLIELYIGLREHLINIRYSLD